MNLITLVLFMGSMKNNGTLQGLPKGTSGIHLHCTLPEYIEGNIH